MADLGISGLGSSGIDVDQQINKILESEFADKYENLNEEQSDLEESKGAWRDVNSKVSSLEGKVGDLKFSSTFDSMQTASSEENVATAEANSDAAENSYDLQVDQLAQAHRLASDKQDDSDTALGLAEGTFSLEVGEDSIKVGDDNTIDSSTTLNELANYINEDSENDDGDGNKLVKASIVDDRLVLESGKTGAQNAITADDPDNVLSDLGLTDFSLTSDDTIQQAQDAQFDVNGIQDITRSSNEGINDVVDNVTFDLKDTGDTTIEVTPDKEKATDAVQEFVDQYNSSMGFISDKLDYDASSEEAAVLQGDGTLMRLSSNLRNEIMSSVDSDSDYNQLATIGIEIDREGTMSFDEDKFETALEDDPEGVKKLFNAKEDDQGFDGVATKLDSTLDALTRTNGTIPNKIDLYDNRINNVDDEISDLQSDLQSRQESLRDKFTNMETSISEMQAQMSQMQSQMGDLGGGSISTLLGSL
ncbi:MAG: flagellar filament capping protein FliD [Bacillota bacterium]